MTNGERAVEYFSRGYNCAQATGTALAGKSGIDEETLMKLLAGFGGGVGGQREMCGAVSGMVFALGLALGGYAPTDTIAKTDLYRIIREATGEFRARFGTTICSELLLNANCIPKPDPSVRNAEYYERRPCAHFVEAAAEIASRIIERK